MRTIATSSGYGGVPDSQLRRLGVDADLEGTFGPVYGIAPKSCPTGRLAIGGKWTATFRRRNIAVHPNLVPRLTSQLQQAAVLLSMDAASRHNFSGVQPCALSEPLPCWASRGCLPAQQSLIFQDRFVFVFFLASVSPAAHKLS